MGAEDGSNLGSTLLNRLSLRGRPKSRSIDSQASDIKEQARKFGDKVLQHLAVAANPSHEAQLYVERLKALSGRTTDSVPGSINSSTSGLPHSATTQAGSLGAEVTSATPGSADHLSTSRATPLSRLSLTEGPQPTQSDAPFDGTDHGDTEITRVMPRDQSRSTSLTIRVPTPRNGSPRDGYFPSMPETLDATDSSPSKRTRRYSLNSKSGKDGSNPEGMLSVS